jgi:hypothetical protein
MVLAGIQRGAGPPIKAFRGGHCVNAIPFTPRPHFPNEVAKITKLKKLAILMFVAFARFVVRAEIVAPSC